jgi:hypothetical protein
MIEKIAFIAAVSLPLFNIPLIARIIKRKSSADISVWWAFGVWGCLLLMAPQALTSADMVWRAFNIVNLTLFTAVVIAVVAYRTKKK